MLNNWLCIRLNRMEIHNNKQISINRIVEKHSTNSSLLVDLRFILDNHNSMKTITCKHLITELEPMEEDKETINSLMETSIVTK